MRLWSVILVCSAIAFCPATAENTGEGVWYDASGEAVKRVKRVLEESKPTGETPSWEPAWVIRERIAVIRSQRRVIRRGSQCRQGFHRWSFPRYSQWNLGNYTSISGSFSVSPGKWDTGEGSSLYERAFLPLTRSPIRSFLRIW